MVWHAALRLRIFRLRYRLVRNYYATLPCVQYPRMQRACMGGRSHSRVQHNPLPQLISSRNPQRTNSWRATPIGNVRLGLLRCVCGWISRRRHSAAGMSYSHAVVVNTGNMAPCWSAPRSSHASRRLALMSCTCPPFIPLVARSGREKIIAWWPALMIPAVRGPSVRLRADTRACIRSSARWTIFAT